MEQNHQFQKMTKTPVGKLITTLSIPTIISMLVTAIYNMADTFFVSKLGTSASGAVGIVFSVMAIIQAISFTFGMFDFPQPALCGLLLSVCQNALRPDTTKTFYVETLRLECFQ